MISLMSDIEYLENGEKRPQFGFAICAMTSVLLRYLAVVCIDIYIEGTSASDYEVNLEIVGIIRKATDGQWLRLIETIVSRRDTWNVSEDKKDIIQVLSVLHEIFEQKPNLEAKEKEDYQIYRRRKNREVLRQNNGDPRNYKIF